MPGDKIASHPSKLQIRFTEADHRYVDEMGRDYTSVTTLIHGAFPQFDVDATAPITAAKRGISVEQIKAEWKANGERASRSGTRMHENAEYQILGQFDRLHRPEDDAERIRFAQIWKEVDTMQGSFPLIEPEKIVFSPRFRIAGSLDLWAKKQVNGWLIGDWKLIKELKRDAYRNETGIIFPTMLLPNCNFYHYSLQLSIYELILKIEGYIDAAAHVERWLFVYNENMRRIDPVPVPSLITESALLLLWHLAGGCELGEVPF